MPIVGDVLADRYRIESILGVGGMASVYQATDLRLDRQVAVKVLVANLAADAQFAERFNREAGAMAGFSHPNVVAVYDVEPGDPATGREPFYVMEYCRGGSLADRLKAGGRMEPAELIPIVAAVSEGLAELHRHGLIHRDVKPANILFASDRPKLADFGVAWDQGPREGDPLTLPGTMPGTAVYLAPELIAGEPPSAASDVYALGVTIFQSFTGQFPQPSAAGDANAGEADADLPTDTFLPVSAAAPDLGLRFDAPVASALDPDPAARPSPAELAAELTIRLETWGVARHNPGAVTAPDPLQGAPPGVDFDAPTRVAVERPPAAPLQNAAPQQPAPQQPAPQQRGPQPPPPATAGRAGYGGLAISAAVLAIIVILAVVLPPLLDGDSGAPGASPAASAEASATAPVVASATAPATASPTASPTVLSSDDEAVVVAVGRVDAAIESARGGKKGLTGRDANELAALAASVRTAADQGDPGAAATAAQALSDRGRALASDLDKPRRDALLAAIDELLAALSPR